jgi:hypothetical protein
MRQKCGVSAADTKSAGASFVGSTEVAISAGESTQQSARETLENTPLTGSIIISDIPTPERPAIAGIS